jgi:hypothetical protein
MLVKDFCISPQLTEYATIVLHIPFVFAAFASIWKQNKHSQKILWWSSKANRVKSFGATVFLMGVVVRFMTCDFSCTGKIQNFRILNKT